MVTAVEMPCAELAAVEYGSLGWSLIGLPGVGLAGVELSSHPGSDLMRTEMEGGVSVLVTTFLVGEVSRAELSQVELDGMTLEGLREHAAELVEAPDTEEGDVLVGVELV